MASRRRLQTTADVGCDRSIVNAAPIGTEQLAGAEIDELDERALSELIGFFKMWTRKMRDWREQETELEAALQRLEAPITAETYLTAQRTLELANRAYSL